jgi:hypothetical protein
MLEVHQRHEGEEEGRAADGVHRSTTDVADNWAVFPFAWMISQ